MKERELFFSRSGWLAGLALVIPLLWLAVLRPLSMGEGETANDAYYHIAMAERGPETICAKRFPQLELSVWRDTFADKEFFYHLLLSGLVYIQRSVGVPVRAPFHFPALVFMALALGAFLWTLKRLGVARPLWLPMTLLSVLIVPNIAFRFLMLRPHVLSLAWLLTLCGVLSGGSLRFRVLLTLPIAFFYTWSYSNPQFVLLPALVFALCGFRRDGWKTLLIVTAAAGGVGLGLLVHPQFPNSFFIWKVQSFDALFGPLLADGARGYRTLMPPAEMMPPDFTWHRIAFPLYVFAYFTYLTLARLIVKPGARTIPPPVYALAILSLLFLGGTFVVQRTMEYAAPFTALLGAAVVDRALKERIFLPGRERPMRFCFFLTLGALGLAVFSSAMNLDYTRISTPPATGIGFWMERNLPEKTLVVNLNWGDFPAIFQANRKQIFLWGMDPAFSVAADPKRTRAVEQLLLQPERLTPRRFYALTGARYALVLAKRESFVKYLRKIGWRTVYHKADGALLTVDEREYR